MKYTKKIGDDYITFTEKDIDTYAPNSFSQAFKMFIGSTVLFIIGYGLILLINELLLLLVP